MPFGLAQPAPDEVQLLLWRGDAVRGLLLERVQDIDGRFEPNGVDRPVRIAVVARDDLQDAGAETLQALGVAVPEAGLGLVDREAEAILHGIGESLQIRFA